MSELVPTPLWLSGRVLRWHTNPRMSSTQDRLDGHHARVAQIILERHPDPSVALLRAALTHDAGEAIVGDLPAGMKRQMPEVAERHALVEAVSRDTISGAFPDLSESSLMWLRFGDRLDAYLWAQFHGEDMTTLDWRLAREEIARLASMLGTIVDDGAWDGFDQNEVVPL